MVSLDTCLSEDAIPLQRLVSLILRKPVPMVVHEDNSAAILAVRKGYSLSLRHLPRTQRICLGSLHEVLCNPVDHDCSPGTIELVHHETNTHKGDMFTKEMPPKSFKEEIALIRVSDSARRGGGGHCANGGGTVAG